MDENNQYIRQGTRSKMSVEDPFVEEDGEEWNFEQETWNVAPVERAGQFVQHTGIEAALEALGPFDRCQTCLVEYIRPRTPITAPGRVLEVFPGVLAYPDRTVWILGMEGLSVNRETGCREVRLYLVSSDSKPHFTDLPNGTVKLKHRYFILEEVELPEWLRQELP